LDFGFKNGCVYVGILDCPLVLERLTDFKFKLEILNLSLSFWVIPSLKAKVTTSVKKLAARFMSKCNTVAFTCFKA